MPATHLHLQDLICERSKLGHERHLVHRMSVVKYIHKLRGLDIPTTGNSTNKSVKHMTGILIVMGYLAFYNILRTFYCMNNTFYILSRRSPSSVHPR